MTKTGKLCPPIPKSSSKIRMRRLKNRALLLAFDNWRTGMGWEADGPQAGYFPFYLALILAAASIFGLVSIFLSRMDEGKIFVTRDQLRRVIQVFIPTLLFCLATQWLGCTSRVSC